MNIDAEEFIATIDDIMKALKKHNIGDPEATEVLGILYSMKGEIIRV
jgi:hemoglobin